MNPNCQFAIWTAQLTLTITFQMGMSVFNQNYNFTSSHRCLLLEFCRWSSEIMVNSQLLDNLGIPKPWRSLMINIVARKSHISPLKALRIENDRSMASWRLRRPRKIEIPNGIVWAEFISLTFEQADSKIWIFWDLSRFDYASKWILIQNLE